MRSLTILDCENIKRAIQHFNSIDIQHELKNDQVLLLRIHIMAGFDAIATTDLEILNEKCLNKSIVVLLKGENPEENQNNFLVYWKSRDHDKLLTLTSFYQKIADNNENVFEFIIEFLSESLSKGEIGEKVLTILKAICKLRHVKEQFFTLIQFCNLHKYLNPHSNLKRDLICE